MTTDKQPVTIQTPSGEVAFQQSTSSKEGFDDSVTEISQGEFAKLECEINRAPAFIAEFVSSEQFTGDILEDLDLAFAEWLNSHRRDRFSTDDVIQIVGSTLGFYSISRLRVRWARVTDSRGTDIALIADTPPTRSYPFSSVQYRIEDNKTNFIVALYRALEHNMKSAAH
ncbi:MAG: hypothetical protein ACR2FY_13790 [Pirellulaceae bacterium]